MYEAMSNSMIDTEDYQGVRDVLAVIHDAAVIRRFVEVIDKKSIILADGHHRYEGSLIYKRRMLRKFPGHTRKGFNYHLIYLTNTESDDLKILPTHRLIKNLPGFNEAAVLKKFEEDFIIKPVADRCAFPADSADPICARAE